MTYYKKIINLYPKIEVWYSPVIALRSERRDRNFKISYLDSWLLEVCRYEV